MLSQSKTSFIIYIVLDSSHTESLSSFFYRVFWYILVIIIPLP